MLEARERGEKAELEKRKKVEQKMAQIIEKDKVQSADVSLCTSCSYWITCCGMPYCDSQNKDFLKSRRFALRSVC